MKISYRAGFNKYIDITESPEDLGQTLTSTGLEVENIELLETIKGGLKGLVIGEVITCSKNTLTPINSQVLPWMWAEIALRKLFAARQM